MGLFEHLRHEAAVAPESGIVAVIITAGVKKGSFHFGPAKVICRRPILSGTLPALALANGETFYTWQAGIPELRLALSDYYKRHFNAELPAEHFYITGSGMIQFSSPSRRRQVRETKLSIFRRRGRTLPRLLVSLVLRRSPLHRISQAMAGRSIPRRSAMRSLHGPRRCS